MRPDQIYKEKSPEASKPDCGNYDPLDENGICTFSNMFVESKKCLENIGKKECPPQLR